MSPFLLLGLLLGQFSEVQALSFQLITTKAPWAPRYTAHLQTLSQSLTYLSSNITKIAPRGSFLLLGGYPTFIRPYTPQLNEVWITPDQGRSWDLVDFQGFGFTTDHSIYCSDPLTDRSYVIVHGNYTYSDQVSPIWTSRNQSSWERLVPRSSEPSPFVSRDTFTCTTDSFNRVYYIGGCNSSTPYSDRRGLQDVWQSLDQGRSWKLQTRAAQFGLRYASVVGMHRNNSHLQGRDLIYLIGGAANFSVPILRDIWASSDLGVNWIRLNPQVPWRITWDNVFYITRDGLFLILSFDNPSYIDIWTSLDGGIHWSYCSSVQMSNGHTQPTMAVDLNGYPYLIGGYGLRDGETYNDVWKAEISLHNWEAVASACGTSVPAGGVGLQRWPDSSSFSSSSSLSSSSSRREFSSSSVPSRSSSSPTPLDSSTGEPQPGSPPEASDSTLLAVSVTVGIVLLSLTGLLLYLWYVKRKYGRIIGWCCRPNSSMAGSMQPRLLDDSERRYIRMLGSEAPEI